ncbi:MULTISPECIES: pyruvate formate-lyase-activating protein [Bacteria]
MVHSWELVTAVDGPGTRMTVFLSGCPLRCQYCQNPDTWVLHDGRATELEEIVDRLERYKSVFDATGGGLTLSGGEPLLQRAFVEKIFAACSERGISTALDTSGYLGDRASDALLDTTSLVLLDVKSGLPDLYRVVTTRDLEPTVRFGDRLSDRGNRMWIRFVLVPGLTDAQENVEAVADILQRWSTIDRVEVLPFHQMGQHKWEERGIPYALADLRSPDEALLRRVEEQFRRRGLPVV